MKLRRLALTSLALCALAHPARASNYLALGDSVAYGFTTLGDLISSAEGYLGGSPADAAKLSGNQGYALDFADYLSARSGVPTTLTNLAIPGETLNSFLVGGNTQEFVNLNYDAGGSLFAPTGLSQSQLLAQDLARTRYDDITVQLGGNDGLGIAGSAAFQAAAGTAPGQLTAAQQAIFTGALNAFDTQYVTLLTGLRQAQPGANIFVIGNFDLFTPLDSGQYPTTDPYGGLIRFLLPEGNAHLQADALAAGVTFVDVAPAFAGRETTLSNDTLPFETAADAATLQLLAPGRVPPTPPTYPDYHPNAAGYAVIAQQIEARAAVPEPSAWALLALSLPLLGLVARRRKAV